MTNRRHMLPMLAGLLLLMTLACSSADAEQGGPSAAKGPGKGNRPAPKPVPIAVTEVSQGPATSYYNTTATLEAETHAEVIARTNGIIKRMMVEEGDVVKAGDVLIELEDDQQKLAVRQAVIRRDAARSTFARQKRMHEQGILSPQDFEVAENDYNQRLAEVEEAELNLSYTTVRAPFSGQVVRRLVDLGAHVQNNTPLFEMMDVTPLLSRVHVPANRMGGITVGQELKMTLDSTGELLMGKVRLVSPIVDPNTGTVKVTAEINDYPEGTRPGDFAEVNIVTERRENAMLVPSVAVFEEQGRNVLFVAVNGFAERRQIEVGFVEQGNTEVVSGVEPGDLVVVKGQRNLRPKMPVEILEGPSSQVARTSGGLTGAQL